MAPGFQISVGLKKKMVHKNQTAILSLPRFTVFNSCLFQTKRLKKDAGGQCGDAPLRLFKNHTYSRRLCALDQKYWSASNVCSCLSYSYNMPEKDSTWPVCNASRYFTCMVKAMRKCTRDGRRSNERTHHSSQLFLERARDKAEDECPQDCNITEFQQYVSFSKLSPINIDALLTEKQRWDMQVHYLAARVSRTPWCWYLLTIRVLNYRRRPAVAATSPKSISTSDWWRGC